MKSKKLLKYGLPSIAVAGLTISLPFALTSCNSDSKTLSFSQNLESVTHVSNNNSVILQVNSNSDDVNYQWLLRNNKSNTKETTNDGWQLIPSQTRSSLFLSSDQVKQYENDYEFACLIYNSDKTDYKLSNPTKLLEANPTFKVVTNNSNLYPNLSGQYNLNVNVEPVSNQVKSNYKYDWYMYNEKNGMQSIELYKTTNTPNLVVNRDELTKTSYILCAVTNQSTGETQLLSKDQIFVLNYDYIQISDILVNSKVQIVKEQQEGEGEEQTKTTPETTIELQNLSIKGELKNPQFKFELLKYDFVTNEFKTETELQVKTQDQPESQDQETNNNVTLVLPSNIADQDVYKIKVTVVENNSIYASKETNPFITLEKSSDKVSTPNPVTLAKFINNIQYWNNSQLSQLNWQKSQEKPSNLSDESSNLIPLISPIGVPTDSYKNSLLTSIGFSDSEIKDLSPEVNLQLTSKLEPGEPISVSLTIKLGNSNTWLEKVVTNLKLQSGVKVNLSEDKTSLSIQSGTAAVYTELQSNVTNDNVTSLVTKAKTWSTANYLNANNIDSSGQIKKPISSNEETPSESQEEDYSQGSLWNEITQTLWATKSTLEETTEEPIEPSEPSTPNPQPAGDVIKSMSLIPSKVVTPGQKYKVTIEVQLNKKYAFALTKLKNGENGVEISNGNLLKIKDVEIDYAYVAFVSTTSSNVENFISNVSGLTSDQLNSIFTKWSDTSKPLTINLNNQWSDYTQIIELVRDSLNLKSYQIKQIEVSIPSTTRDESATTTISNLNFKITLDDKYQFDKNKVGNSSGVTLTNNNKTINIPNISVSWNKTK